MMMLGTNDVWNGIATASIITALSTLVDQMRASKPSMRVLVAKIPPMNPGGCDACNWPGQAQALGDAIAVWAPTKSTSTSPVTVVDCWTGFVAADFSDGVHMTSTGTEKLANCWYEPVKAAVLAAGGGSVSTTSGTARTSSTTTSVRTTTPLVTTTSRSSTTLSTTSRLSTTLSTTTTLRSTTAGTTTASSGGSPLYGQCGESNLYSQGHFLRKWCFKSKINTNIADRWSSMDWPVNLREWNLQILWGVVQPMCPLTDRIVNAQRERGL